MPKKKLPQTIEECNAELERTQKLLQQYENRNKILNRKLSVEKRKERNHRIFLFGGFMESIVPELKTMTEDEGKDFLYHIAKSSEARGWKPDNTLGNKGALIHLVGASSISFVSPQAAKLIHSAVPPLPTKFCNFAGTP